MSANAASVEFVGKYDRYPDLTGKRQAEGGRRVRGQPARTTSTGEPLVTILTVCWNSAATIEQTIASVQEQTYGNIEHVVVDGASTDATVDILRKHEEAIDYFVSEPDQGLYYAMNKGLELARGDYILILNSDDWYLPDCVEALLEAKRETKADLVSGLANYVDGDGQFLHMQPSFSFDGNMYFMMPLRHETMLLSRDIYDRVGPFDTGYRVIADRVFTTRLYEFGHTHHEIQRPLMNFRDTGVSSVNLDGLRAERCKIVAANFPFLGESEVDALAHLEQLSAEALREMVRKHAHPKLSHAAADMVRDRQSRNNKKYMVLDVEELRGFGAGDKIRSHRPPRGARMLRVATLITSDHGGAGIGSQRRVEALRKAGVDARLYCVYQNSPYAHVQALLPDIPGAAEMRRPDIHKIWRSRSVVTKEDVPDLSAREFFSKTGTIIDFDQHRRIFDEADIIHIHWPVGMLDYDRMAEVIGDKPVVWTPADMNPFTGGCHYSEGCDGYMRDCRDCPLLGGGQLAHESWKVKNAAYSAIKTLEVVSPSKWLAERARKSSLFGDRRVHVIPNAFPVERFNPINRKVARIKLGLPQNKRLILFGADNVSNLRKGGDLMMAAIRHLRKIGKAEGVEGVYFGANAVNFSITTRGMGHITDEEKLSLVYAAADVFASPSREDSGPMTVAESMLSGTPVVAFDVGNAPEIIKHRDTGYIARLEDVEDFTNGLVWALEHAAEDVDAQLRCHLDARRHNDPARAAARHVALYHRLLGETACQPGCEEVEMVG